MTTADTRYALFAPTATGPNQPMGCRMLRRRLTASSAPGEHERALSGQAEELRSAEPIRPWLPETIRMRMVRGWGGTLAVYIPGMANPVMPVVTPTPSVGNYINSIGITSVSQSTVDMGFPIPRTHAWIPSAGGGSKPFSEYTRPTAIARGNHYTTPTNNGTLTPYTQPTSNRSWISMNFNAHVSEQINGVQTMQRGIYSGTPGVETNTGGVNGLVNPHMFQNYRPTTQCLSRFTAIGEHPQRLAARVWHIEPGPSGRQPAIAELENK